MKIFAIDDDPITLALVAEVLRNAGHQVTTCASSRAALAKHGADLECEAPAEGSDLVL